MPVFRRARGRKVMVRILLAKTRKAMDQGSASHRGHRHGLVSQRQLKSTRGPAREVWSRWGSRQGRSSNVMLRGPFSG
ncbi:hypothetical protein GGTG_11072 [Gaeumannomyces tritici R3-111a-1]|uniref:Uncharacterized protein n=1 Tax=Gaeumannomyces tritici (strain R3-111a-1) TaxID=644352 RepID=J3PC49_GAET3|nr:hypothetical protein GGTG_11072 [Gaeumannomyces tritici R3-111a-1]EJT71819.1 hypothetical protein GGTG_11072 [Gaeumannomyces tritici R3-111a-1]